MLRTFIVSMCAAAAVLLAGCAALRPAPPLSAARLVLGEHAPGAHGKLGVGVGVVTGGAANPTWSNVVVSGASPVSPVVEASLSLRLSPHYHLAVWTNGLVGATGNLVLVRGALHLGVLHGLGIGVEQGSSGWPTVPLVATLGLDAAVPMGRATLFLTPRVVFATNLAPPAFYRPPAPYMLVSAGVLIRAGSFLVTPELVLVAGASSSQATWLGTGVLVSLSAPF